MLYTNVGFNLECLNEPIVLHEHYMKQIARLKAVYAGISSCKLFCRLLKLP